MISVFTALSQSGNDYIEAAFEKPHVTIDFAGFSGETLKDSVSEALDKIRVEHHARGIIGA